MLRGQTKRLLAAEVRAALLKRGLDPIPSTPERFAEFIRSEIAKYAEIVKDAGIKID
jgi:tripartite-type tricarboxylate transporter receptor subunit TctC